MNKNRIAVWMIAGLLALGLFTACVAPPPPVSAPQPASTPQPEATPTPEPTPTPTPDPGILLRFSPEAGKTYWAKIMTEQELAQTVEGEEIVINQIMGFGFQNIITDVDADNNAAIDMIYDWLYMYITAEDVEIEYDSANPAEADADMAAVLGGLVDKGYSIKISETGEVLEISGVEEMFAQMIDEMGITDEDIRQELEQSLKAEFGDASISQQLGGIVVEFPDHPLQIGDSWSGSSAASSMIPLNLEHTYTLLDFDGESATIAVMSIISATSEQPDDGQAPPQEQFELSGSQEGTMILDLATGFPIRADVTQFITGTVTIAFGEEEITVPMSINTILSIEMSDEDITPAAEDAELDTGGA